MSTAKALWADVAFWLSLSLLWSGAASRGIVRSAKELSIKSELKVPMDWFVGGNFTRVRSVVTPRALSNTGELVSVLHPHPPSIAIYAL